jgi:hypothetical protein
MFWGPKSVSMFAGITVKTIWVEEPMTDHLRDYAPTLEKYKAMQIKIVIFFGNFIPYIELLKFQK